MEKNIQYRRTDRAIINAFLLLAAKKPFHQISVQDIMDEALVSRYTFYKHFKDKYEIAERLQAQLMDDYAKTRAKIIQDVDTGIIPEEKQYALWEELITTHRATFIALRGIRTDTVDLIGQFHASFRQDYLSQVEHPEAELEADIYAAILSTFVTHLAEKPDLELAFLDAPLKGLVKNVATFINCKREY